TVCERPNLCCAWAKMGWCCTHLPFVGTHDSGPSHPESSGMADLLIRDGCKGSQDGPCNYSDHDRWLHPWATVWSVGCRLRIFVSNVALDRPGNCMGCSRNEPVCSRGIADDRQASGCGPCFRRVGIQHRTGL